MNVQSYRRLLPFALVFLAGALVLGVVIVPRAASAMQPDPVTAAWEKVRAAGSYHFNSDVVQMTIPVAKVTNVGRQYRTEQLRLEGETNLRENRLAMQLWSEGGSILQSETGVAVKVENGRTWMRGAGGEWRETDDFADGLATQGDFMAYDPDIAAGSNVVLQLHNLALNQGVNRVVQTDNRLVSGQYTLKSDSDTAGNVRTALIAGAAATKFIANTIVMERYLSGAAVKQPLGDTVVKFLEKGLTHRVIKYLKANPRTSTAIGVAAGVGISLLLIGGKDMSRLIQGNATASLAVGITLRTLVVRLLNVCTLIDPILTVLRWIGSGETLAAALHFNSVMIGATNTANIVGAVIAVGVVWGFFIYSMVSNKVYGFSPEFNKALAETIAGTIYILILSVQAATVVGLIIVGIRAVIDSILTAICELGVGDLRSVPGLGGACFTLGTAAIKAIAYFLYNYDVMIDTGRSDLVAPGGPNTQLADPTKSFVTGNELQITMPITTHTVHKNPDPANGLYINAYLYYFSPGNLRSSTFKYSLTQPNPQPITGVGRDQMSNEWTRVGVDHKYAATPIYGGYASTTPARVSGFNLQPGLNKVAPFLGVFASPLKKVKSSYAYEAGHPEMGAISTSLRMFKRLGAGFSPPLSCFPLLYMERSASQWLKKYTR